MPYYEVTVTASKPVCVKADNEQDAIDRAVDELYGTWNRCGGEIEDEYDENNPKEMEFVEDYKRQGDYYEA